MGRFAPMFPVSGAGRPMRRVVLLPEPTLRGPVFRVVAQNQSRILTMKHTFTVVGYIRTTDAHECVDSDGNKHRIDLLVNGDLPPETKPEDLVGKRISCASTFPYISIGVGVEVEGVAE